MFLVSELEGVCVAIENGQEPDGMLTRFNIDMNMVIQSLQEPAKVICLLTDSQLFT